MKAGTFSLAMIQPLTKPTRRRRRAPRRARPHGERQRRAGIVRVAQRQRRQHRGQAHHPADAEIDAGGDDDEGLAEPEQQHRNDGDQDVLRIADGEEVDRAAGRQRHRDDEEQHHHGEKQPRPDAAQEQRQPLQGRALAGAVRRRRGRRSSRERSRLAFLRQAISRSRRPVAERSSGRERAALEPCASADYLPTLIDEARDRRVLHVVLVDDGEAGLDAAAAGWSRPRRRRRRRRPRDSPCRTASAPAPG